MQDEKVFIGNNEADLWQQVKADLKGKEDLVEYHSALVLNGKKIFLDIDMDPGGGFENGYSSTVFLYNLSPTEFRLAIHPQNFVDDIGKFFGMEDVIIGYPEFDKQFIIKTNNGGKAQAIFSNKACREIFQSINNFTLEISESRKAGDETQKQLILNIEEAIADSDLLQKIYYAFSRIIEGIESIK